MFKVKRIAGIVDIEFKKKEDDGLKAGQKKTQRIGGEREMGRGKGRNKNRKF